MCVREPDYKRYKNQPFRQYRKNSHVNPNLSAFRSLQTKRCGTHCGGDVCMFVEKIATQSTGKCKTLTNKYFVKHHSETGVS